MGKMNLKMVSGSNSDVVYLLHNNTINLNIITINKKQYTTETQENTLCTKPEQRFTCQ